MEATPVGRWSERKTRKKCLAQDLGRVALPFGNSSGLCWASAFACAGVGTPGVVRAAGAAWLGFCGPGRAAASLL
eukprot:7599267-Alexandrium_andersonii.AAC.1